MEPASIIFDCPHCHTRLTVPSSMAGISGPCPSCGQTISAPHPQSPQQGSPIDARATPSTPPTDHHIHGELPPRRAPGEMPQRGAPSLLVPQGLPPQPQAATGADYPSPSDAPPPWLSGAQEQPRYQPDHSPSLFPTTSSPAPSPIANSPAIIPRQAAVPAVVPQRHPDFLTAPFNQGLSTPSLQASGAPDISAFPAGSNTPFPSAAPHRKPQSPSDQSATRAGDRARKHARQSGSKVPLLAAIGAILVGVLVAVGLLLVSHFSKPNSAPTEDIGTQAALETPPSTSPEDPGAQAPEQPAPTGQTTDLGGDASEETVLRAQPALVDPDFGNDILDLPPTPDPTSLSTPDDSPQASIDLAPAPLISAYPVPPGLAEEAAPTRLIFSSEDPEGENVVRTLLAFLRAPDWQGRLAHVYLPETVRPTMERIYSTIDDGPIPIAQIEFLGATAIDDEDDAFYHCNLHDPALPGGTLRVVLASQGEDFGVDWVYFAQTYHKIFDLFSAAPTEGIYRFNLTLRRVHTLRSDFPNIPNLAEKDAFEAACSGNSNQPTVFVRDGSEVASTLKAFIPWRGGRELPQFVVADLRWDSSEGEPLIVVERFHQLGWHPDPEIYATGRVE